MDGSQALEGLHPWHD